MIKCTVNHLYVSFHKTFKIHLQTTYTTALCDYQKKSFAKLILDIISKTVFYYRKLGPAQWLS